jgi:hypothetical protein
MTRGPLGFKESDLIRAIKSALKAGLKVAGFEINPKTGSIVVHTSDDEKPEADSWDRALKP